MTQVQHNMNALTAYNKLNTNVAGLKKSSEKLASGYRINRAGDDAAGLAISEKMRSQIKGLNQAIRNSQDGINMIQTYEGAAQETHSILQRMKELAVESANGTYDNATDRAAIQLEFDQLNDELNQIADTDFNGTVVLNGGVMADGTVAQDGEFRYANGYTETVVAADATDISGDQAHTIVDQSTYTKEIADAVWKAVGADVTKNTELNVTFMYDGERWVADTVTDKDGKVLDGARASGLGVEEMNLNGNSGNGGFKVIAGKEPTTGKNIYATNAIFDEMDAPVKKGDTLTIQFENSAAKTYAPKNVGLDEDYNTAITGGKAFVIGGTNPTVTTDDMVGRVEFTLDSKITDSAMDGKLEQALTALDNAQFEVKYNAGVVTITTDCTKATNADDDALVDPGTWGADADPTDVHVATDGTVTYGTGANAITLGKFDVSKLAIKKYSEGSAAVAASTVSDGTTTITTNGTPTGTADLVYTWDDGNNQFNVSDGSTCTKANMQTACGVTLGGTPADGEKFTFTAAKAAVQAGEAVDTTKTGDVTFSLNVDAFNFASMDKLSVHSVATPKVATMASQVAAGGVSKADSFDNSTGVLTYTDNLTLQTGARTKDSVNFSFSYNQDGTADMGDLVANLDLSARSTGLNTASLNLANQKDANYAIDQIDKAINKTSMVRATFGSIQNRLEHKITNLTTTSENLTEAESSIRDTDMASEMMNYTKFNILQQAAQSMLAQANQQPQSILQLLG